jgi:hypothetical protein
MKKRLMFPQVVPKTKSIEAVQMYHAETQVGTPPQKRGKVLDTPGNVLHRFRRCYICKNSE